MFCVFLVSLDECSTPCRADIQGCSRAEAPGLYFWHTDLLCAKLPHPLNGIFQLYNPKSPKISPTRPPKNHPTAPSDHVLSLLTSEHVSVHLLLLALQIVGFFVKWQLKFGESGIKSCKIWKKWDSGREWHQILFLETLSSMERCFVSKKDLSFC